MVQFTDPAGSAQHQCECQFGSGGCGGVGNVVDRDLQRRGGPDVDIVISGSVDHDHLQFERLGDQFRVDRTGGDDAFRVGQNVSIQAVPFIIGQ